MEKKANEKKNMFDSISFEYRLMYSDAIEHF